jgi:hypothetical protein
MGHFDAPTDLKAALDALAVHSINHPPAVTEAIELWQRVRSTRPAQPGHYDIRDAVLAGADPVELGSLIVADLGAQKVQNAWSQAEQFAAQAALAAILEHRDHYHQQLAKQAAELIAKLEATAAVGGAPLDALIRAGRTDEAKLVADLEQHAAALDNIYRTRDLYLVAGGWKQLRAGQFDCSRWENPTDLEDRIGGNLTLGQGFLCGINGAGRLWFPTGEQARAAAQQLYDAWEAEQIELKKQQAGVGSYISW